MGAGKEPHKYESTPQNHVLAKKKIHTARSGRLLFHSPTHSTDSTQLLSSMDGGGTAESPVEEPIHR